MPISSLTKDPPASPSDFTCEKRWDLQERIECTWKYHDKCTYWDLHYLINGIWQVAKSSNSERNGPKCCNLKTILPLSATQYFNGNMILDDTVIQLNLTGRNSVGSVSRMYNITVGNGIGNIFIF